MTQVRISEWQVQHGETIVTVAARQARQPEDGPEEGGYWVTVYAAGGHATAVFSDQEVAMMAAARWAEPLERARVLRAEANQIERETVEEVRAVKHPARTAP